MTSPAVSRTGPGRTGPGQTVVIPTIGRASLRDALEALLAGLAGTPGEGAPATSGIREIIVVDDRPAPGAPLPLPGEMPAAGPPVRVLRSGGRGPAAARNAGWRAAATDWVAFLDDDVVPAPDWPERLAADLADLPPGVGGSQGRITVPPPDGRAPTDWERGTAALARAEWITADMAYRRDALAAVGGFDERFPRAYREDAELAHRVRSAGWRLVRGRRVVTHPVRPESRWISLRTQRGNADDALLRRLYGPRWRSDLGLPPGRRHRHAAVTTAGVLALVGVALHARPPRHAASRGALGVATGVAALAWAAGTAEFARARIAPGPRRADEVTTMLVTSALIPPLAVTHWLRGWWRSRGVRPGVTA